MVREILPCFANALDLGSDERIVSQLGLFLALPSPFFFPFFLSSLFYQDLWAVPLAFFTYVLFVCLF